MGKTSAKIVLVLELGLVACTGCAAKKQVQPSTPASPAAHPIVIQVISQGKVCKKVTDYYVCECKPAIDATNNTSLNLCKIKVSAK